MKKNNEKERTGAHSTKEVEKGHPTHDTPAGNAREIKTPALDKHNSALKKKAAEDEALLEKAEKERLESEAEEVALSSERDLMRNAAVSGKLPVVPKNQVHLTGGDNGLGSGKSSKN